MYPSIYDMFADLFGIHWYPLKMVQSFGFFVAIAFLAASYFFSRELKRKEQEGLLKAGAESTLIGAKATTTELVTAAVIGFLLGYKLLYIILHFKVFVTDTQGYILSMKGSVVGGFIGAALSGFFKFWEKKKDELETPVWETHVVHPYQHIGNMTLIAAVAGLVGAKIFNSLENFGYFLKDPVGSLIGFSGLTIYGGLIFGAFAVLYYAHKKGLKLLHVVDACAPALILAYGIGRIGCQVAGDGDWGINNPAPKPHWMSFLPNWMWAYNFPHNVNNVGIPIPGCVGTHCHQLAVPVFPTSFYETTMCMILFIFLWAIRKKVKAPGVLFCIYLVVNGIERFFIELIRINTRYHLFGISFTQAEFIAPIFFLLGVIGIWYFNKRYKFEKLQQQALINDKS